MGLNQRFSGRRFRHRFKLIWNGGLCFLRGVVSGTHWPIRVRSDWERTDHFSLKEISENFDTFSSSSFKSFKNFHSSSMAPKRRAGKEVATSVTEGHSPPPVIERPIAGKGLPILIRDCRLSFKADIWLSLDEPKNDQIMICYSLGNSVPWISLAFLNGSPRTEEFFFKLSGEAIPFKHDWKGP